jgi:hypothetical protein
MNSKWTLFALLFSVAVNIAVVGTLVFFWRHNANTRQEINIEQFDELENNALVWFHSPDSHPHAGSQMDSLRKLYQQELFTIEGEIGASRNKIVQILLSDPIDSTQLDNEISRLAQEQTHVERLTINHLLDIKPLLPENEWRIFLNDLKPHRTIRTKIIKIGDDTSQIIINDSEMHILKEFQEKEIIIEHRKKEKRSKE